MATSRDAATPAGNKGVLTDKNLTLIAKSLGNVFFQLGMLLNLTRSMVLQIETDFKESVFRRNFEVLVKWRDSTSHLPNPVNELITALKSLDLNDVVKVVQEEFGKLSLKTSCPEMKEIRDDVRELKTLMESNERKACKDKFDQQGKKLKDEQQRRKAAEDEVHQLKELNKAEKQPGKTAEVSSHNLQQRLLVVGGLTNNKSGEGIICHKLCHYWEEGKKCWELLTELPQSVGNLFDVSQVACDLLLLTGGLKGDVVQGDCWLLDTVSKTWTQLPPLTTPRHFHRSVFLGDHVYVVGGKDVSDKVTGSVERFDMERRQWSSLPALPLPVYDPATTSHGHRVYVIGGIDADKKRLSCTQAYDTTSGQWLTLTATPKVCDLGAAVSLGSFIYLVGGGRKSCLRYDPAEDRWTVLNEPRLQHVNAPAVVWQGGVLVAGHGGGDAKRSAAIEVYDAVRDEWSDWLTPLKVPLASHRVFSVILSGVRR